MVTVLRFRRPRVPPVPRSEAADGGFPSPVVNTSGPEPSPSVRAASRTSMAPGSRSSLPATAARTPGLAGRAAILFGRRAAHLLECVAPVAEVPRAPGDEFQLAGVDLGAVLGAFEIAHLGRDMDRNNRAMIAAGVGPGSGSFVSLRETFRPSVAARVCRTPALVTVKGGRRAGVAGRCDTCAIVIATQSLRRLSSRTNGDRNHGEYHDPQPR